MKFNASECAGRHVDLQFHDAIIGLFNFGLCYLMKIKDTP